jgi:hypothetical protein
MNFTGNTEGGIPQLADGLDGCSGPPDALTQTNSFFMNFTGDTEGGIPQPADGLDGCVGPPDVLTQTNSFI